MSTKPVDAGRFAVDGSDVNATNISAPSGSLRNTGFPDFYIPPAAEFNYLENIAYRWRQWLFDGDCAFHNLSATGTFQVGGATTLGAATVGGQSLTFTDFTFTASSSTDQLTATANPLDTADGPVRVSNSGGGLPSGLSVGTDYYWIKVDADHGKLATSRANAIAGTAIDLTTNGTGTQTLLHQAGTTRVSDLEVTRNLTVDGQATVSGRLTPSGGVAAFTATGLITASAGLTANAVITANSGVTVATNQDLVLSGDGRVVHDAMTMTFTAGIATRTVPGGGDTGPTYTADGDSVDFIKAGTGSTSGKSHHHFFLPTNVRLQAWSLRLSKNSSPGTLTAKLFRVATSIANQVGSTQTISSAPGNATIGESGLNHLMVANNFYFVEVGSPSSGGGSGTDQAYELTITYDQPPL